MNITELINNLSEESIIAISAFSVAIIFYVLRLISTLKSQISNFESEEKSGRQSLQDDLVVMNGLIDELRYEFKSVQDNLEEELVEHELLSLTMSPQFKNLEGVISDTLDDQSDSMIDLERNLTSISNSISNLNVNKSQAGFSEINNMLPTLIDKIRTINQKLKTQCSFVYEMQKDLEMIKKACGVE
jgi:dGTP triphosphohydrolase